MAPQSCVPMLRPGTAAAAEEHAEPAAITSVQWKAGQQSKVIDAAPGKMLRAEHGSP